MPGFDKLLIQLAADLHECTWPLMVAAAKPFQAIMFFPLSTELFDIKVCYLVFKLAFKEIELESNSMQSINLLLDRLEYLGNDIFLVEEIKAHFIIDCSVLIYACLPKKANRVAHEITPHALSFHAFQSWLVEGHVWFVPFIHGFNCIC